MGMKTIEKKRWWSCRQQVKTPKHIVDLLNEAAGLEMNLFETARILESRCMLIESDAKRAEELRHYIRIMETLRQARLGSVL